jgi:hypothetical protein
MKRLPALVCLAFGLILAAIACVPETLAQSAGGDVVAENSRPGASSAGFGRRQRAAARRSGSSHRQRSQP